MRKPLRSFWLEVERVISYIRTTVSPQALTNGGVATLAPYLLSDEGWDIVKVDFLAASATQGPWLNFVSTVECHFGVADMR